MITRSGNNRFVCTVKLSQFLRYYERVHGIRLSPEKAEEEAAKTGFEIDYSGENRPQVPGEHKAPEQQNRG